MYKKGYKTRLIEERSDSYIIDLYPEDIKGDLIRVRLTVGKSLMNLKSLEYKKRDGIIITIKIDEYNLTVKPDPGCSTSNQKNIKALRSMMYANFVQRSKIHRVTLKNLRLITQKLNARRFTVFINFEINFSCMEKYICENVFVPLRSGPSHKSEMLSQVLFGEKYIIWIRQANG